VLRRLRQYFFFNTSVIPWSIGWQWVNVRWQKNSLCFPIFQFFRMWWCIVDDKDCFFLASSSTEKKIQWWNKFCKEYSQKISELIHTLFWFIYQTGNDVELYFWKPSVFWTFPRQVRASGYLQHYCRWELSLFLYVICNQELMILYGKQSVFEGITR
jgi:hypothetical protein